MKNAIRNIQKYGRVYGFAQEVSEDSIAVTLEMIDGEMIARPFGQNTILTVNGEEFRSEYEFRKARQIRAWKADLAERRVAKNRKAPVFGATREEVAQYCQKTETLGVPEVKTVKGGYREINGKKFRPVKQAEALLKTAWGR